VACKTDARIRYAEQKKAVSVARFSLIESIRRMELSVTIPLQPQRGLPTPHQTGAHYGAAASMWRLVVYIFDTRQR
jgi:hypothetical protein